MIRRATGRGKTRILSLFLSPSFNCNSHSQRRQKCNFIAKFNFLFLFAALQRIVKEQICWKMFENRAAIVKDFVLVLSILALFSLFQVTLWFVVFSVQANDVFSSCRRSLELCWKDGSWAKECTVWDGWKWICRNLFQDRNTTMGSLGDREWERSNKKTPD